MARDSPGGNTHGAAVTRRLLAAFIVALFVSLLCQWCAERALDRYRIHINRLPNLQP